MTKLFLKKGREAALRKGHPWVFSGAVARSDGTPQEGDIVTVHDEAGELLALGHYAARDIAVRVLSFSAVDDWPAFWTGALSAAYALRSSLGLTGSSATNAYRLVNAEGDMLPGLVIDIYDKTAVVQCQSSGMKRAQGEIAGALQRVCSGSLAAVYLKKSGAETRGAEQRGEYLWGAAQPGLIRENGLEFFCDWECGQKTGFYLDQRENRSLVERWAAGRSVLNAFSYTGGFSVYALRGGAKRVCSVDASKDALILAARNIEHNFRQAEHTEAAADCFRYLDELADDYEMIILDPPAFVKHKKALLRGLQGYEAINRAALRRLAPGGVLFTFSCSQLVSRELFAQTVMRAAAAERREVQVLAEPSQAPCHPTNLSHPEGAYLKGLLLYAR